MEKFLRDNYNFDARRPKTKVSDWMRVGAMILVTSFAAFLLYAALIQIRLENVLLPSRRLANASYVLWTIASCCIPIFLTLTIKMLIVFMAFQVSGSCNFFGSKCIQLVKARLIFLRAFQSPQVPTNTIQSVVYPSSMVFAVVCPIQSSCGPSTRTLSASFSSPTC